MFTGQPTLMDIHIVMVVATLIRPLQKLQSSPKQLRKVAILTEVVTEVDKLSKQTLLYPLMKAVHMNTKEGLW